MSIHSSSVFRSWAWARAGRKRKGRTRKATAMGERPPRRGVAWRATAGAAIETTDWLARTCGARAGLDRKSTRLNSSHTVISYAVFCLKKKKTNDEQGSDAGIGYHIVQSVLR